MLDWRKKVSIFALSCLTSALVALPAWAQVDLGLEYATSTGLGTNDVRTTIGTVISYFLGLLGLVAVLIILYAGFLWMTAGGNSEQVEKAKKYMINGVIGLIIIMSAFAIAQFVLRAIVRGTGFEGGEGGGGGRCPPGAECGIPGGGVGGFRITGVTPVGDGRGGSGWPKNYAITIAFSHEVSAASVDASTLAVERCNPRLDGDEPSPFDEDACGPAISGTRNVEGSRVIFRPDSTPGDEPTDFEGDFWYRVRVSGGEVTDARGRILVCPFLPPGEEGDISSPRALPGLCDRAMAFNNLRDVEPPRVRIDSPVSFPAYCSDQVRTRARAEDDFLVSRVDFRLDGGLANLVSIDGEPLASAINTGMVDPFIADSVYIDLSALADGEHELSAVAQDGVPQASEAAERTFRVNPAHCCNEVRDEDLGEEGVDCGLDSGCGSCPGAGCQEDADCVTGFCDPETGRCVERPVILDVSTLRAGPGSLITLSGRYFGNAAGRVIFLGGDTDGDGEVAGDDDDQSVSACAPGAWSTDEVVVAVPDGAVSGPLRLVTSVGRDDRTDDDFGPLIGAFVVNDDVLPGICYLEPSSGSAGQRFVIHGAGFGEAIEDSLVRMNGVGADVAGGGWTSSAVTALVPAVLDEGAYPVRILVGGVDGVSTNAVNFSLRRADGDVGPQIIEISPPSGPVGSYVTLRGSGFGRRKGIVRFLSSESDDVGIATDPVCDDSWHDNYVVIKVPEAYVGELDLARLLHFVELETAAPARTSNRVNFTVNVDPLAPGMCSITPSAGPPGTVVTVSGEGFGPGPANVDDVLFAGFDAGVPENSLRFYAAGAAEPGEMDGLETLPAVLYPEWSRNQIRAAVPGNPGAPESWPETGPVFAVSRNTPTRNPIPFIVGNCNDEPGICAEGTSCCANGSCRESCEPEARNSKFGWVFSTDVLPSFPTVVQRSSCDIDEGLIQSPTPQQSATDACRNMLVGVEFSAEMNIASLNDPESIRIEECGDGRGADCSEAVVVSLARPVENDVGPDDNTIVFFRPSRDYPPDDPDDDEDEPFTGYFRPGFWYRVTLVSDPEEEVGIFDIAGRFLDGNYDRRPGGNYSWTFRTRLDPAACGADGVIVNPPRYTISHQGLPPDPEEGFSARLTAGNCNILRCDAEAGFDLDWSSDPGVFLRLLGDGGRGCRQLVEGLLETPDGTPEVLTATLRPEGEDLEREGRSSVTVAFADPRVVRVMPTEGCSEACLEAVVGAVFNVPMSARSFEGNIELLLCRNASCNAPYVAVEHAVVARPDDGFGRMAPAGDPDAALQARIALPGGRALEPNSFYKVRIRGGADGVLSTSDVPLTGLNAPGFYEWTFHTRPDGGGCTVSRAEIVPRSQTLRYVGERLPLNVEAYGPAGDECSPDGQEINAWGYDWIWSIDPNPVLAGFIMAVDGGSRTGLDERVDTEPKPVRGCDSRCLLIGSSGEVSQCANTLPGDPRTPRDRAEQGEDCDDGNLDNGDGCNSSCLAEGAGDVTCGNGALDAVGEICEAILDPADGLIFPPGCKDPSVDIEGRPELNGIGCVLLGSDAGRSVCGDGFLGDGEACEDGNRRDGDGCSSNCLKEGTKPPCGPAVEDFDSCVSQCGNGRVEPGEDADCEAGAGVGVPPGCDALTCTKTGSVDPADCGNGLPDAGEECDDSNVDDGDGCSSRCLYEGSSPFYRIPSFCGDGVEGPGEYPSCDGREVDPDGLIDDRQVVVAGDYDPELSASTTSVVRASVEGLPDGSRGLSRVSLSCTCGSQPDPDGFCSDLLVDVPPEMRPPAGLACSDAGCCAPRPYGEMTYPADGSEEVCRNTAILIEFDQVMDAVSVRQNLLVGIDRGPEGCEEGETELDPTPPPLGPVPVGGLLRRAWGAVVGFFGGLIGRPAVGHPLAAPHAHYCAVPGDITVRPIEGGGTQVMFDLRNSVPSGTRVRVRVNPDTESVSGVRISPSGLTAHFKTGDLVCAMDSITVSPNSILLNDVSGNDRSLTARGVSNDRGVDRLIVPTEDYAWSWDWEPQPERLPHVSPVVLNPVTVEGRQTETALVRVRGREIGDGPEGYVAQDGEAVVSVSAVTVNVDGSTDPLPRLNDETGLPIPGEVIAPGTADVTVLLCDNPWPSAQLCEADGTLQLPWDPDGVLDPLEGGRCVAGVEQLWYPFIDPETKVSFYYCRDNPGGDGDGLLPAINEDFVRVSPGGDILREYLFTFADADSSDEWRNDAIGFRVMKNSRHLGVLDWYRDRGFRGSPSPLLVDRYDALQEGRTVYASSANLTEDRSLYTNVNVFSVNDGAAPESVSVFSQVLDRVNLNRQPELANSYICKEDGSPVLDDSGRSVACIEDLGCPGDSVCDVPKLKLIRDVRRWSDLHTMRSVLLANQPLPKLSEGTFIRSRTYSAWPSWSDVLSSIVGQTLPSDPLNSLAACPEGGYDLETCWNSESREFLCGERSHVYRYQTLASRAELSLDFEYEGGSWVGDTCIELVDRDTCEGAPGCVWNGGEDAVHACNYETVGFQVYGLNAGAEMCSGEPESEAAGCGNGIINPGEVCELGDINLRNGDADFCTDGTVEQACAPDCRGWADVPGTCRVGFCGDGRVTPPEICDDGPLNGTYGHCNGGCSGASFYCGDGISHPSELCDCRELNGRYAVNGVLADPDGFEVCDDSAGRSEGGFASCSWDCRGPAPHCGDGIINGTEECDGGSEESRGACLVPGDDPLRPSGSACNIDSDCNQAEGERCVTCPTVEQSFRRACNPNNLFSVRDDRDGVAGQSCHWSAWSCTAPGACGNGVVETGEECDDGNDENNDICTNECKNNVCGDGYVNAAGGELCDNGARNNEPCEPEYGLTCSYCTSACRLGTVSGGFCGDGEIQDATDEPPGDESCEPISYEISSDLVCVSERPGDRSFGKLTGLAICSEASCGRGCADRESTLCNQAGEVVNTDDDDLFLGGVDPESCTFIDIIGDDLLSEYCERLRSESQVAYTSSGLEGRTLLRDVCDPDKDNDGVPDDMDCEPTDPAMRPAYRIPGTTIQIPAGIQRCEGDGDCDGELDDLPPFLHRKVDMVFVLDVTGSMNGVIESLISSLQSFVRAFDRVGAEHRFGYVTVGQEELGTLNMMKSHPVNLFLNENDDGTSPYMFSNLVGVGNFNSRLQDTLDNCWDRGRRNALCEISGREALYAAAYALMRPGEVRCGPADGCGGEMSEVWDYEVAWRHDAQPYVVIVSDEPPPVGTRGEPVDLLASIGLDDVSRAAKSCILGGCEDGYVELFVISKEEYQGLWLDALPTIGDGTGSALTADQRYISYDRGELDAAELGDTLFEYICH